MWLVLTRQPVKKSLPFEPCLCRILTDTRSGTILQRVELTQKSERGQLSSAS